VIAALANAIVTYNPTAFTIAGKPIPAFAPHSSRLVNLWGLAIWPLLAVPILYITGSLLRWTGSLLGGTAKAVEVRTAIAWPAVLSIVTTLILFVVGFVSPSPSRLMLLSMKAMRENWRSTLPYMIVWAPLWLWWRIASLKCLGEVHRFSAWRALGAVLIAYLLLGGALLVALLVVGTFQTFAWEMSDDPLIRAMWLSLAVTILIALLASGLFWKYWRSSGQS
jgi:hypothetical protein